MDKHFDFKGSEDSIYQFWLDSKLFESNPSDKPPFVCLQPPPNVTGVLHIGHALNSTMQDILIRYHKLLGYNTLFIPGTDHAGLSLQHVVEKELLKKKITRHQLTREQFLEEANKWKDIKHDNIINQFKKLGCAFDWSREQFTMNEHFSNLVLKTFVKLHHDGLIYRGKYIINWCPKCGTALSNDEVEKEENNDSKMYYIKYPLLTDPSKYIVIATTRPETMFGDTAIACNPGDERCIELEGKKVIIPIINRGIPIIKDHRIHKDFGTGLVKITPAHNKTDYQIGQTHHLPQIQILNERCKIINTGTKYDGMDRYKCREEIVKELSVLGFVEKIVPHANTMDICYKCHTVIEPYLSDQWFVKMAPLIELAQKHIKNGDIQLIPEYNTKLFFDWTDQDQDWCISRQIWWGHQIPIWYCQSCQHITCQETEPETCSKCQSKELKRDPDVLDTWFSSALWAHGVFKTDDEMKYYYPPQILITGKDILFFWVSRMIMMSTYLTDHIPFNKVLLHGIVRDIHGEKMSKTKGNGIDPLDIIEKYGTDALRYTLIFNMTLGEDLNMSEDSIRKIGRPLCTKLWNSARYLFMNIAEDERDAIKNAKEENDEATNNILDKLNKLKQSYHKHMESYNLSNALKELSDFFWNDFCSKYLEDTKSTIHKPYTKKILSNILMETLILYHPFIPFITEELWSYLRKYIDGLPKSIMMTSIKI